MPTYEFHCLECEHRFTQFLSIIQRKTAVCPKCGSKQIEQIYRCCNVVGGKGSGSSAGCTRTGGCSGCSGCS